ncbi:dolichol kinase [Coprinopsis cinerea okayama7|uniref:dolichol kinase n=1 Tax=Coprinopsis cinerea (strain Okayama-7 / 130 / ATCC MYA-4618 / FGSC 9003) TaxID=240176 RepID=D6RM32_COPC7|nr:dolichol kinase [Coprinopsis cinerea okayama7\|eukprot:XP_002911424.1 dolichol kinase [Coprinopsis cinerea okayama7\
MSASSHLLGVSTKEIDDGHHWHALELRILAFLSACYIMWTHSELSFTQTPTVNKDQEAPQNLNPTPSTSANRSSSPRAFDNKDMRKGSISSNVKADSGYIWMSVPKNYRDCGDDGIATGLLLGPLIATSVLISSIHTRSTSAEPLPKDWLIEPPRVLPGLSSAMDALVLSRHSLVNLSTFCATILLIHVCASWWLEGLYTKGTNKPEGERASVPRSEGRRFWYYALFTVTVSLLMVVLKITFSQSGIGIWKDLSTFEAAITAPFYSLTLYAGLRLAHRGFTVGELGLVCLGGTAVCLEFLNLTKARIWPITTRYIRTYRLPTPLLIFQIALIVGSLLTGFLLSPFLVLSRNNAQRPAHRIRSPEQKLRNRRYYALGFYVGSVLIIVGLIGLWTRWLLGNRDPWLWTMFYLLEGRNKWSRPVLLGYWALLGSISVAGWGRQLSRSRKYRLRSQEQSMSVQAYDVPMGSSLTSSPEHPNSSHSSASPIGGSMSFATLGNIGMPSLPNLPNGSNVSNVASELLDAADKRVPTLSLNARRKYFHGLAVLMFVPGVAFDPAFTHLAFSAAFALFTFTEYIRYFAVYPFGAAIHLFMNDFLDHRDGGTAILSHFYLLTGCSGSLWLEDPSKLRQVTGILTLGVGDAAASIVGRRIGLRRWSPTTGKTVEGSLAFVGSIFATAWFLRLLGFVETFPSLRYLLTLMCAALLEALSDQNDNLTLPLYTWSMLVVIGSKRIL